MPMSEQKPLLMMLDSQKTMFDRSTGALDEGDSGFAPQEGLMTVAQQVAHVAQSLDWFIEGAFERPDGPDLDFEGHMKKVLQVTSLAAAREWMDRSWARAKEALASRTDADLDEPFAGELFGGQPKRALVDMNADHVAHHRGALTVYARLLGKTPPMPYM